MNGAGDLERRVADWLHADASAAGSEMVLGAALTRVDGVDQQGRRPSWQLTGLNRYTRVALAFAAVVIVVLAVQLLPGAGGDVGGQGASASPSSTPRPVPTYRGTGPLSGRTDLSLFGVLFSVDVPLGWEGFPHYISRNTVGPQGAEAKLFWTTVPAEPDTGECWYLRSRDLAPQVSRPDPPTSRSMADLAAAVSEVPGTELVTGPDELTVGGYPARYVEFIVRDDVGCDPGFFFVYPITWGGALWPETVPGDTIRVWVVDLGSTRFFIEGATNQDAGPELIDEVHHIVESIQFE